MKLLPNHSPSEPTSGWFRVDVGRTTLSRIAMMMASGDEMRGEQGDALATVAKSVVETLEEIEETRQNICRLAWKEKQAPKPIAKDRRNALRIVDAVHPGDGGAP